MATASELRAALAVAELEEALVAAKDNGDDLGEVKADLRYARWVARGGPAVERARLDAGDGHTNRAVADLYGRWLTTQEG